MNILPLIIGFIVIFSFLSMPFLKEAQGISIIARSIQSSFHIETHLHNIFVRRQYERAAQVPKPKLKTEKSQKLHYSSLRQIFPPNEYTKLNIAPLLSPTLIDPHQHPIYSIAAQLIYLLYNNTSLLKGDKPNHWETLLLDAMIKKGKTSTEKGNLFNLFPDDPQLQTLYYKMMKGTNQYDIDKKIGIPPLGHFLSTTADKLEHTLYFHFASPSLLQAAVGEKMASHILIKEKKEWEPSKKYYFISKEELQNECMTDALSINRFSQIEPYLNFHKKLPPKKELAGKDSHTGLTITRQL